MSFELLLNINIPNYNVSAANKKYFSFFFHGFTYLRKQNTLVGRVTSQY